MLYHILARQSSFLILLSYPTTYYFDLPVEFVVMGTSLFENCSQNLGLQWVQAAAGQAVEAAFAAQMFVIVGEIVGR